ncbi:MAG: hypothetical protein WA101_03660 [Minisyncoccia bacterium]
MKTKNITSLKSLTSGSIITALSESGNLYTLMVHDIDHKASGFTKINFLEFNEHFTRWGMELPTECNEKNLFVSPHDSSYSFVFFTSKFKAKELSKVLTRYMKLKNSGKQKN